MEEKLEEEIGVGKFSFLEFRKIVRNHIPLPPEGSSSSSNLERVNVLLGILKKNSSKPSIFAIPNELRKVNEAAYKPRIVSIGPLHQGADELLAMEEHKWQYMLNLLQRTPDAEENLKVCHKAILDLEEVLHGSYAKSSKYNTYELVEIMLVDGCFILELFIRSWQYPESKQENDIFFRNVWMVPTLQLDLALLENQIPFLVLQSLFEIFKNYIIWNDKGPLCRTIDHLALCFFHPKMKGKATPQINEGSSQQDVKHLLDLLHNFHRPTSIQKCPCPEGEGTRGFEKCATKLLEAGIELRRSTSEHLLDISFINGVLTIPPLHINEITDSLVRNFIAYEQCSLSSSRHITSYAFLIKSLIQSSRDIELLRQKGIFEYDSGGADDVLKLFKNISREVILKDFYFATLCHDVNAHRNSCWCRRCCHQAFWKVWWNRQIAALMRNYFPNAWRGMAVIVAAALLFFTGTQTYYTVWA